MILILMLACLKPGLETALVLVWVKIPLSFTRPNNLKMARSTRLPRQPDGLTMTMKGNGRRELRLLRQGDRLFTLRIPGPEQLRSFKKELISSNIPRSN